MKAIFDLYALTIVLWNGIDRPRLTSEKLFELFYKDGVFLLIVSANAFHDAVPTLRFRLTDLLG